MTRLPFRPLFAGLTLLSFLSFGVLNQSSFRTLLAQNAPANPAAQPGPAAPAAKPNAGAIRSTAAAPKVRPADSEMVSRLRRDAAALTRWPSRVPGTRGNLEAAQYVEGRFGEIFGKGSVRVDEYEVTAPVTKSAQLMMNGRALKVHPLYPNAVVPASTPEQGIAGPLIYAGQGRARDFNGQKIEGAIVVLDFNSGLGWVTAADLGAKAIVFLEPQSTSKASTAPPTNRGEAERKFASLPLELPRYYAPRETSAALTATTTDSTTGAVPLGEGKVLSAVRWERVKARNILGTIKGTDASLADKDGNTVIINGYYDSMAITPDLAPGAEAAGNCAALLELASYFKANPPKHNVLFVANGAHHIALAGVRNFIAEHFLDKTGKGGDVKKKEIASYRAFFNIDLTSRTDTVGLFAKSAFYNQMTVGSENILLNQFADFAKAINNYAGEEAKRRGGKDEEFYVDGITGREGRTWRSYLPSPVALDSEAATMAQKPGVSFATANDARITQDTPFDTLDRLTLPNLARQVATIQLLLGKGLADVNELPESSNFSPNFGYVVGRSIYRDVGQGASFLPNSPLPDETLVPMYAKLPDRAPVVPLTAVQQEERDKKKAARIARWEGSQAVAFVLDRNGFAKSFSGVRSAFIERGQFSEPTLDTPAVAQFVFVGPRVGDPKGGGTPDYEIETYSIDKKGHITFAPDQGAERQRFSPTFKKANPALSWKVEKLKQLNVDASVIAFDCRAVTLYDTLDQRYFTMLRELTVLDGQTDSNPVEFGFLRPAVQPGASDAEPAAIVFARPGGRFKLIMSMGLLGKRLVLLQTNPEKGISTARYEGAGFKAEDTDQANSVVNVAYQTARDLWVLDHQRINLLKKFGISNERVDTLHGSAGCPTDPKKEGAYLCPKTDITEPNGGAIGAAGLALAGFRYDEFYLHARRAFGLESRAYPDVEGTSQDVLKGIIFYLALLLPFSYFVERLLFGYPDIRKQIAGASVVFLAVFIGIRFVHPAFELAMTPFIILLAFIILALTIVVTAFLSGKFEQEIKKLKQGVHFADVGRLSAIGAALGLGIANMRRRPMRTTLTCVTLILLTFTVLSFTSVTANISNFARPYGTTQPEYEGLMVRNPDWGGMQLSVVNSMRNEFSQRFGTVAPRAWYLSRDQGEALQLRVNNLEDSNKYFYAPAMVGFTQHETAIGSPIVRTLLPSAQTGGKPSTWFDGTRNDVCLLPRAMLLKPSQLRTERLAKAKERGETVEEKPAADAATEEPDFEPLGLTLDDAIGSRIQIAGQVMEVIGVFDDDKFYAARDLDDEQFTPVDYQNEQNKQAQSSNSLAGQKGEEVQVQRYQHMDANALLIIPYDTVLSFGGSTRSLAAGFKDAVSGEAELEQLMNRAALGIFGATRDKSGKLNAALYSSVETAGYEGFGALIIPIAIAALIIANTMLGSVFERTREIGIYSAVGLAPIHVAALFIAEAMVYAVLGSISGYLIAQLVAKVITSTNVLPGITLNYSSSSAILATLIVMTTVLLSTLYPAWAASRLSQPDIDRKWRMSEPVADIWRFQFPFTVSGLQPLGVAQFLADFFEAHTDTSVGKFYTDKVTFTALPLRDAITLLNAGIETAALAAHGVGADGMATRGGASKNDASSNGTTTNGAATNGAAGEQSTLKPKGKLKLKKGGGVEAAEPVKVAPIIALDAIPADPNTEVYRLAMRVWLAPFDMGVSQDTDIILLPANEPGLYELQLRLVRQSGEIAAWKRVNRQFIGDLRKQLLVWRTISREGQQEYILRGRAHVTGQAMPAEEPGMAVSTMAG